VFISVRISPRSAAANARCTLPTASSNTSGIAGPSCTSVKLHVA
jgi:hypothetical protein